MDLLTVEGLSLYAELGFPHAGSQPAMDNFLAVPMRLGLVELHAGQGNWTIVDMVGLKTWLDAYLAGELLKKGNTDGQE